MSDPFVCVGEIVLAPGRELSMRRRHPWVYRGALAGPLPKEPGLVEVRSATGEVCGIAMVGGSGGSLALRVLAFGNELWDEAALRARLRAAVAVRARLGIDADALRLVHAEGDSLPGLVIDRYGPAAVIEVHEPAWEAFLDHIVEYLRAEVGSTTVLVRAGSRRGVLPRALVGELPTAPVVIREGPARFPVDLVTGQKTGFFLDQRENRRRAGELARGLRVLNLFAYSGGFAVTALLGGATGAVNVEASKQAMELARQAYELNGLARLDGDFLVGDAFELTRQMVISGERFGFVIVDPPGFVKSKEAFQQGMRGYKDINLQALRLVEAGGLLLTCSCSALVDEQAFGQMLFAAALDAGRSVRVLERRGAAGDHPVSVFCPEPRHLKAWLCAVD